MAAFARQTETSPTVATDYLPGNGGWAGMDGSGGSLSWLLGPWQGSGYTLSLGVPIIPTSSSGHRRRHPGPGCDRRLQLCTT